MIRSSLRKCAPFLGAGARLAALLLPALAATAVHPRTSHAIGFELTTPGARDAGRAGASTVGADSAFGLFYNPATLLAPSSFTDTTVALHNSWTDLCFTRVAVLEDTRGARTAGATSPEICGDAKTAIIPIGASAYRFGKSFALGVGVYSPPAAGRDIRFGSQSTGTRDRALAGSAAELSPSRYLLMQEHILQTFPTLGVAWAPIKQLRLGASFGWGFTNFRFSTATWSRAIATTTPTEIGGTTDAGSYVSGKDTFTPRVSFGAWTKPVGSLPLELGLSFTYTGDVETNDAKLRLKNLYTDYYPANLVALLGTPTQPALDATFKKTGVVVPQNSVLSGGLRYASKLPAQVGKHGDRMSSERWDLELDYVMTFSRLDSVDVKPPAGASIDVPSPSPAVPGVTLNLPDKISLAHKWKNQYGIRIGGDYTILPNLLTVRAGYSFESDGVTAGYHQLDFVPHKRFGLALGATVRILDLVDLSATYAYLIIPDVTNSVQNAAIRRPVSGSPRPGDDAIANAGTITQTASSLIVEVGIHL